MCIAVSLQKQVLQLSILPSFRLHCTLGRGFRLDAWSVWQLSLLVEKQHLSASAIDLRADLVLAASCTKPKRSYVLLKSANVPRGCNEARFAYVDIDGILPWSEFGLGQIAGLTAGHDATFREANWRISACGGLKGNSTGCENHVISSPLYIEHLTSYQAVKHRLVI